MKRKFHALLGTAASGALFAAMTLTAFAGQVTEKGAKAIALEHAGVKESNVSYSQTDTDKEGDTLIYEVEFYTKDLKEYDYEILAKDGSILSIDYDAEDAFRAGNKNGKALTLEQAKKTAAEHAGKKQANVTFEKAESDSDDGRTAYEIKFYTDTAEYEYEIDADTGYLLKWEYKVSSKGQKKEKQREENPDLDAVKKTALKAAGLKDTDVTWGKVHPDYDDGRLIYEGKFFSGGFEYEFEIDAATGNIIDWDIDD